MFVSYMHSLSYSKLHWSCCSDLEQLLWLCGMCWLGENLSALFVHYKLGHTLKVARTLLYHFVNIFVALWHWLGEISKSCPRIFIMYIYSTLHRELLSELTNVNWKLQRNWKCCIAWKIRLVKDNENVTGERLELFTPRSLVLAPSPRHGHHPRGPLPRGTILE